LVTEAATRPEDAEGTPEGDSLDAGDEQEGILENLSTDDETGDNLEDQPEGSPDEEDADDGEEDQGATPRDAEGWAAIIAENPTRIAETPARFRGQAVKQALELARNTAEEEIESDYAERFSRVQAEAFETGRQAMVLELTLQGIQEQAKEDPSILLQLEDENPQLYDTFLEWRRRQRQQGQQRGNPQGQQRTGNIDATGVSESEWRQIEEGLAKHPEVRQELESGRPEKGYALNLRFYRKVKQMLSEADENAKIAQRRQQTAPRRKGLPKPDATPGRGNGTPYTLEGLKKLSREEMDRLMRENPGAVDAALGVSGSESYTSLSKR